MKKFVLFEKGSAKWIKLTVVNGHKGAEFHSNKAKATVFELPEKTDFDTSIFDDHNIDWFADTIEIQEV